MNLPSYCIELVLVIITLQASYNYLLTYHTLNLNLPTYKGEYYKKPWERNLPLTYQSLQTLQDLVVKSPLTYQAQWVIHSKKLTNYIITHMYMYHVINIYYLTHLQLTTIEQLTHCSCQSWAKRKRELLCTICSYR